MTEVPFIKRGTQSEYFESIYVETIFIDTNTFFSEEKQKSLEKFRAKIFQCSSFQEPILIYKAFTF